MAKVGAPLPPALTPPEFAKLTKDWQTFTGKTIRFNFGAPQKWLQHTQEFMEQEQNARASWRTLRPWKKASWTACAKKQKLNGWSLYLQQYLAQSTVRGHQPISPCSFFATVTEMSPWDAGASTWDGGASGWDNRQHNFSPFVNQPPAAPGAGRIALAAEAAGCTPRQARDYINQLLPAIAGSLQRGNKVVITNFATLYTAKAAARTYRSKKTGTLKTVAARNMVRALKSQWLLALVDPAHAAKITNQATETPPEDYIAGFAQSPIVLDGTTAARLARAYFYLVAEEIAATTARIEIPHLGSFWQYQVKPRFRRMPNYKNYAPQYAIRVGWKMCKALKKAIN